MVFGLKNSAFKPSAAGGSLLFLFGIFTLVSRYVFPGLLEGLPDIDAFSSGTALCFVTSGMALLAPLVTSRERAYQWQRLLGFVLCLIGLASLMQHLFGSTIIHGHPFPAVNTSIAFFLSGIFFILWRQVETHLIASTLFLLTLFIGAIALLGIVGLTIGFDPLFGWSSLVHMTGYTIAGLLTLSITLANKVWVRVKNKRLKQMEGILYLAGVAIVFAALLSGMLIYTIAGANIYNDARKQLHLITHERAERIYTSLQLTQSVSNAITNQIKFSRDDAAVERFVRATGNSISLTVTDINSGKANHYGPELAKELSSTRLNSPGMSLVSLASGEYFIKQAFTDRNHHYIAYFPLRLTSIMRDNYLAHREYSIRICSDTDIAASRCLPLNGKNNSQYHKLLDQSVYARDKTADEHIGIFDDYSSSKHLMESVTIPELHLTLIVMRDMQSIYGALYRDMLSSLPIILLLLIATIALISWRIAPLISTLRRNELRFRLLTENANDMISLHDMNGNYLYASPACQRLLGYSDEELVGHNAYEFIHPDDIPAVELSHNTVKTSDEIPRITYRLLCKDGQYRWFETTSTKASPGAQGEAEIIAVTRDVTDQHNAEEQLRASELRYRTLIEEASDAIFLHNEERRFVEVNRAASDLLGYTRDELIGMHPEELLLPEDHEDARRSLEIMKEHAVTSRRQILHKNGRLVTVEINAKKIHGDGVISMVRDVTEQARMEQALKHSERMNRSVIQVLAEGIVVQDNSGKIVSSNKAANDILGRSESDSQGRMSTDTDWAVIREDGTPFPGDEHPAMVALATGKSQRDVVMGVLRPDGNRIWISVNTDPIFDESEKHVTSVVSSFTDITENRYSEIELRKSQEQLRALTSHLQEVREDEKEMIAREVHDELGSTMTAMKLGMSWIDQHIGDTDPILQEKIDAISRQLDKAVITVRRLVTQLRPTLLDDLGLWAAIEWQLREFAKYSHIEVKDNLHCQQVVLVNRNKALAIYRVIQEALTNIAKHAQANNVRLDCWDRDDTLHITLEDDGIGLTDQTVVSPTSHGLRGMSERIATVGGKLEILGTAGEGTVITIEVPHDEKGE